MHPQLLIAGERAAGEVLEVTSPWDGSLVGAVATGGVAETQNAIDAASVAMERGLAPFERADILDKAASLVRERRELFARILALEIGKPVSQGLVEADRCVQTLLFSAVEARTLAGRDVVIDAHPAGVGRRGFTIRRPIGVIGAITPFNFPLNLAAHKVGPAIAAGCAVVLKPTRDAPLAAAEFASVLYEAGLAPEWLSVIVGPSKEIANALIEDERVGMLTFTGSAEVGWGLAARAPRKRVSLELGNSTPLIVCGDADLEAAAGAVAASGFGFAGQSCISIQRVLVDASVHEEFAILVREASNEQRVGNPLDDDTRVGPLINRTAHDRVATWVEEATDSGSRRLTSQPDGDALLHPVVLDDVTSKMRVWTEEVFGPVVGIRAFEEFDEAIEMANDTQYGLQAGIFTNDLNKALEAAERLDYGGVTINETPTFRVDQMPYGGTKASGNTREGPHFTVREMTEERIVVIGRTSE